MKLWRKSRCFLHNEFSPTKPRFFEFSILHFADNKWYLCKFHPIPAPTVPAELLIVIFTIIFYNTRLSTIHDKVLRIEAIFDDVNSQLMASVIIH